MGVAQRPSDQFPFHIEIAALDEIPTIIPGAYAVVAVSLLGTRAIGFRGVSVRDGLSLRADVFDHHSISEAIVTRPLATIAFGNSDCFAVRSHVAEFLD